MSVYFKKQKKSMSGIRSVSRLVCIVLLFFCLFCWEPILAGSLGSPWWTVIMVLTTLYFAGSSIYFDYMEVTHSNSTNNGFWIRSGLKLLSATVALVLLIVIGVNFGQMNELPPAGSDVISGSDIISDSSVISATSIPGGDFIG